MSQGCVTLQESHLPGTYCLEHLGPVRKDIGYLQRPQHPLTQLQGKHHLKKGGGGWWHGQQRKSRTQGGERPELEIKAPNQEPIWEHVSSRARWQAPAPADFLATTLRYWASRFVALCGQNINIWNAHFCSHWKCS